MILLPPVRRMISSCLFSMGDMDLPGCSVHGVGVIIEQEMGRTIEEVCHVVYVPCVAGRGQYACPFKAMTRTHHER